VSRLERFEPESELKEEELWGKAAVDNNIFQMPGLFNAMAVLGRGMGSENWDKSSVIRAAHGAVLSTAWTLVRRLVGVPRRQPALSQDLGESVQLVQMGAVSGSMVEGGRSARMVRGPGAAGRKKIWYYYPPSDGKRALSLLQLRRPTPCCSC
jgi:hypothetical protein